MNESTVLFRRRRRHSSFGGLARSGFCKGATCVLSGVLLVIGCEKAPPAPIDLSKTPWLDPKVQMEGLKNEDFRIRGLSAFNLGNMGAKAKDAIPELEKLAKEDPNPKVRQNAAEAVEKIRAATGQPSD